MKPESTTLCKPVSTKSKIKKKIKEEETGVHLLL